MEAKIDALSADMKQIRNDLELLKQLKVLMEKMESIPARMDNIEDEMQEISEELEGCRTELAECRDEIAEFKEKVSSSDQYDRINNIIIAGVPMSRDEKVRSIIKEIAVKLEVDLQDGDIQAAHRLPAEENEIPKIIVRLNDRDKKVAIIKASKVRELDTSFMSKPPEGPVTPVYCDDHLLPINKWLLIQAKKMKKAEALTYVWVRDCTVRVKVNEKSKTIILRSEDQLNALKRELGYQEPSASQERAQSQFGAVVTEVDPSNNTPTKKRTVDDRSPEAAKTQQSRNYRQNRYAPNGPSSTKATARGSNRAGSTKFKSK